VLGFLELERIGSEYLMESRRNLCLLSQKEQKGQDNQDLKVF